MRASLSLPFSEHRPSREERPRPPVRPLALSSVTARADGRAEGGRHRLLARLHLARAPLPLKGRTDRRTARRTLSCLAARPSCLLRWSFFVGVKECAGSPLTGAADTAGASEEGRARPQMSPRSGRAGGASRPGAGPARRSGPPSSGSPSPWGGPTLNGSVSVSVRYMLDGRGGGGTKPAMCADGRTEAVTETASFEASRARGRAGERSVGRAIDTVRGDGT